LFVPTIISATVNTYTLTGGVQLQFLILNGINLIPNISLFQILSGTEEYNITSQPSLFGSNETHLLFSFNDIDYQPFINKPDNYLVRVWYLNNKDVSCPTEFTLPSASIPIKIESSGGDSDDDKGGYSKGAIAATIIVVVVVVVVVVAAVIGVTIFIIYRKFNLSFFFFFFMYIILLYIFRRHPSASTFEEMEPQYPQGEFDYKDSYDSAKKKEKKTLKASDEIKVENVLEDEKKNDSEEEKKSEDAVF
jgi:hypothetical protein